MSARRIGGRRSSTTLPFVLAALLLLDRRPLRRRTRRSRRPPQGRQRHHLPDHDRRSRRSGSAPRSTASSSSPAFPAPYTGTNSFAPRGRRGDLGPVHRLPRLPAAPHHRDHPRRRDGGRRRPLERARHRRLHQPRRRAQPDARHEPYVARVEIHQIIPLGDVWEVNEDRGPISSLRLRAAASARAARRQDVDRRSLRHQPRRLRQPHAVHELDRRQQRRLRLRRRHARLHLRRRSSSTRGRSSRRASARC